MTLFYSAGPAIVSEMRELGFRVFVDLKLHDIPHQVAGATTSLVRLGADMLTVHAGGGRAMLEAATTAAAEEAASLGVKPPAIVAVTVLTSLDDAALAEVGCERSAGAQVAALATLAAEAGCDGVVCSPREVAATRAALGASGLIVTPGVRPAWASADDQARTDTPVAALAAGASYLVIGRPITAADDPVAAARRIIEEG